MGRTAFGGVFWCVCELIMILGSLSASGWGCLPSFLWWGVQHWSLLVVEWSWVLAWDGDLWESSCQLILCGAGRPLVVQCLELGSPTSEAQAWHPARAPRPCQPHGFWEVWGLLPAFSRCSVGVILHIDVLLIYLWGGRWSPHLTPPQSWRSSLVPYRKVTPGESSSTNKSPTNNTEYLHYLGVGKDVSYVHFLLLLGEFWELWRISLEWITTCSFLRFSASVLKLWWGWSLLDGLFFQVWLLSPPSCHKRAAFFQRCWDLSLRREPSEPASRKGRKSISILHIVVCIC